MSEKKEGGTPIWVKIMLPVLPAVVAAGSWMFGTMSDLEKQNILIMEKLTRLEEDRAKWVALGEHEEAIEGLVKDLEIIRAVWEYHTGKHIPREFPTEPGEAPLKPTEAEAYWEQYQQQQMKRFPNEPVKKK